MSVKLFDDKSLPSRVYDDGETRILDFLDDPEYYLLLVNNNYYARFKVTKERQEESSLEMSMQSCLNAVALKNKELPFEHNGVIGVKIVAEFETSAELQEACDRKVLGTGMPNNIDELIKERAHKALQKNRKVHPMIRVIKEGREEYPIFLLPTLSRAAKALRLSSRELAKVISGETVKGFSKLETLVYDEEADKWTLSEEF